MTKRGNQYSDNEYQVNPSRALKRFIRENRGMIDNKIRSVGLSRIFLSDSSRAQWLMTHPDLRLWIEDTQGIEL